MPVYPIVCECGFVGDVVASGNSVDAEGRVPCQCGRMARQDYGQKNTGFAIETKRKPNLPFKKTTSLVHQFSPEDAPGVAELMGSEGSCIQPDGTVEFKAPGEATAFNKKFQSLLNRTAEKDAARKERAKRHEIPTKSRKSTAK